MTDMRTRRLNALAELLRGGGQSRQDALVAALRAGGFEVTQATVSRDLDALGAIKLRQGGVTRYALPEPGPVALPPSEARLRALFAEWVRAAAPAASLVVLRTPPGSAHLVGVALDAAALPRIVGTICGDDTLFIACGSAAEANDLAAEWQGWIRG